MSGSSANWHPNVLARFERYYYRHPKWISPRAAFHQLIAARSGNNILEIGAGPTNETSTFLSTLGRVTGLDIDGDVATNSALAEARKFDGLFFPFPDESFDLCVSNYVLEHIENPGIHFSEVTRVLRPGGSYVFRTPNIWHYVTLGSRLLPHSVHLLLANWLRGIKDGHDPYPTVYHANSRAALLRLAQSVGLVASHLEMIEPEPTYGAVHPVVFFPMMAYERTVSRFQFLSAIRANILGVLSKPNGPRVK